MKRSHNFAIFCIARIGSQVRRELTLLSPFASFVVSYFLALLFFRLCQLYRGTLSWLQIYDTSLVHPVDDRTCADVSFGDVVEFGRVAPHFELTLEIYAHALDGKAASR